MGDLFGRKEVGGIEGYIVRGWVGVGLGGGLFWWFIGEIRGN